MAAGDGGPIYCLMSALSTKAKSIAPVMLEVVNIMTFGYLKELDIIILQLLKIQLYLDFFKLTYFLI